MSGRELPLGVDVGESRVRVAALAQDGKKLRLISVSGADIVTDAQQALVQALNDLGSHPRTAVSMVRSCDAALKVESVPALSLSEFRRAARYSAAASLGGEEDLTVRAARMEGTKRESQMIVAVTRRSVVAQLRTLLLGAGLNPVRIDHEGACHLRAGYVPLLDIGRRRSTFVALVGGAPFVRGIPLGGEFFTEGLADALGINRELAETRKKTIGLCGAATAAIENFVATVGGHLATLREAEPGTPAVLYLSGNGARLKELGAALERRLGVRPQLVDVAGFLESGLPSAAESQGACDWYGAIAAALPLSNCRTAAA